MNPLNIIDSIYSGRSYRETFDTRLERGLKGEYSISRFPLMMDNLTCPDINLSPYSLDFESYNTILSRVRISTASQVPVNLRFTTFKRDWDLIIPYYSNLNAVIYEPIGVDPGSLLYSYEDYKTSYLTPIGLLAVLFRKSYGNDKFKQYINSTLLRNDYYKISTKGSPTFYIHKMCNIDMDLIRKVGELFITDRWKTLNDILISSPFVFSWRD